MAAIHICCYTECEEISVFAKTSQNRLKALISAHLGARELRLLLSTVQYHGELPAMSYLEYRTSTFPKTA